MNNENIVLLSKEAKFVLSAILPKKQYGRVVDQVEIWLTVSGPEWTVGRLKAINTAAYQLRAGNLSVVKEIYQNNSISYRKSDLMVKGPLQVLMYNFVHAQKPSLIKKWAAGLRLYTDIKLTELSYNQYLKAKRSITGDSTASPGSLDTLSRKLKEFTFKFATENNLNTTVEPPNLGGLKAFTACHREMGLQKSVESLDGKVKKDSYHSFEKVVASLVSSIRVPGSLHRSDEGEDVWAFHNDLTETGLADTLYHGHISFIQEGGCKARCVAVPNAWVQYYMKPLHDTLDKIAKQLPFSAVHEQNKAGYFFDRYLGNILDCKDLSSATDRFPIELQCAVLEGLGLSEWTEALLELCEGWKVSTPFGEENWTYAAGQPMGMYGSFALFHLTHYILIEFLKSIVIKRGNLTCKDASMVLGDDVILADHDLSEAYSGTMERIGVELSGTKSITSDTVSEFAGFLHVKTNLGYITFRPYKFSGSAESRAINVVASLGKSISHKSAKWDEFYQLYRHTASKRLYDLSPITPSDEDLIGVQATGLNVNLLISLLQKYHSLMYPDRMYSTYGIEDETDTLVAASHQFLLEDMMVVSKKQSWQPPLVEEVNPHRAIKIFSEDTLIKEQRAIRDKVEVIPSVSIYDDIQSIMDDLDSEDDEPSDEILSVSVYEPAKKHVGTIIEGGKRIEVYT